jgi:hypothetical protein
MEVQAHLVKNKTLSPEYSYQRKRARAVAQVVEHLPNKC